MKKGQWKCEMHEVANVRFALRKPGQVLDEMFALETKYFHLSTLIFGWKNHNSYFKNFSAKPELST